MSRMGQPRTHGSWIGTTGHLSASYMQRLRSGCESKTPKSVSSPARLTVLGKGENMDTEYIAMGGLGLFLIAIAVFIGCAAYFGISDALTCKEQTGYYACKTPSKDHKKTTLEVQLR